MNRPAPAISSHHWRADLSPAQVGRWKMLTPYDTHDEIMEILQAVNQWLSLDPDVRNAAKGRFEDLLGPEAARALLLLRRANEGEYRVIILSMVLDYSAIGRLLNITEAEARQRHSRGLEWLARSGVIWDDLKTRFEISRKAQSRRAAW